MTVVSWTLSSCQEGGRAKPAYGGGSGHVNGMKGCRDECALHTPNAHTHTHSAANEVSPGALLRYA
eukprot:43683-Chlamydomonas_euryale.AAC.2